MARYSCYSDSWQVTLGARRADVLTGSVSGEHTLRRPRTAHWPCNARPVPLRHTGRATHAQYHCGTLAMQHTPRTTAAHWSCNTLRTTEQLKNFTYHIEQFKHILNSKFGDLV